MNDTEQMLADLNKLVCDRLSNDDTKRKCIRIAFELGMTEGRVAGAKSMGEHMTESLNRSLDEILTAVKVPA